MEPAGPVARPGVYVELTPEISQHLGECSLGARHQGRGGQGLLLSELGMLVQTLLRQVECSRKQGEDEVGSAAVSSGASKPTTASSALTSGCRRTPCSS